MATAAEPAVVTVEVRAHLYDWRPGDIKTLTVGEGESLALLRAGLVIPVDDELRTRWHRPPLVTKRKGCGCR